MLSIAKPDLTGLTQQVRGVPEYGRPPCHESTPISGRLKPATKANCWPRPNYVALVRDGHSQSSVRLLKFFYDSLPSRPRLHYPDSPLRFARAIELLRDAALLWLSNVSPLVSHRSRDAYTEVIRTVFNTVWGYIPNDPCYFTKRHAHDEAGFQLRVLLGDERTPFKSVPNQFKLDSIARELGLGWPQPRPAWEKRKYFVVSREALCVESRGGTTQAVWPLSPAKDRGFLHTFTEHREAVEWLRSMEPFVLVTTRDHTQIVTSHPTEEAARGAAREVACC